MADGLFTKPSIVRLDVLLSLGYMPWFMRTIASEDNAQPENLCALTMYGCGREYGVYG
jgi:hypothetical protein